MDNYFINISKQCIYYVNITKKSRMWKNGKIVFIVLYMLTRKKTFLQVLRPKIT